MSGKSQWRFFFFFCCCYQFGDGDGVPKEEEEVGLALLKACGGSASLLPTPARLCRRVLHMGI